MALQLRFFQRQLPRYKGVRWSQLVLALGPLHICKVALEPKHLRNVNEDTRAPRPRAAEFQSDPDVSSLADKDQETPIPVRRVELPPLKDPGVLSQGLPSHRHGGHQSLPLPPSPAGRSSEPIAPSPSPYLDDGELDLLANLLCESGLGSDLARRPKDPHHSQGQYGSTPANPRS